MIDAGGDENGLSVVEKLPVVEDHLQIDERWRRLEKIEFEFYYNSTYLIIEASSAEPATRLGILPECASGTGEPTWSGKTKARKSWMNRRSCRCSTSTQSHRINTGALW